jgi:hypothetical protein
MLGEAPFPVLWKPDLVMPVILILVRGLLSESTERYEIVRKTQSKVLLLSALRTFCESEEVVFHKEEGNQQCILFPSN